MAGLIKGQRGTMKDATAPRTQNTGKSETKEKARDLPSNRKRKA